MGPGVKGIPLRNRRRTIRDEAQRATAPLPLTRRRAATGSGAAVSPRRCFFLCVCEATIDDGEPLGRASVACLYDCVIYSGGNYYPCHRDIHSYQC